LEAPSPNSEAAGRLLADAVAEMINGQAEDVALETEESIELDRGVRMAAGKTGALLSCAAAIGAVLAGADSATISALASYGTELGLSFQAVDDILGIWGEPATTGKPVGSDLAAKKKTLPVAFAAEADPEARAALSILFRNGPLDAPAIVEATAVVERAGGRDATEEFARTHLAAALDALDGARFAPAVKDQLADIAHYVCERRQ
jgi:geranylgeranyl diphosphate synthase type I